MFSYTSLTKTAKKALHHRGLRPQIIALGSILISGSMLTYQIVVNNPRIGVEGSVIRLQILAAANLAVLIGGLVMVLLGMTSYLRPSNSTTAQLAPASPLSIVLSERSTRRLFAISSVAYGIVFGFVSGTFVFRTGSFSETYGVSVPSTVTVICCGSLGQIPQLVVYVTKQFAILLTPINIVLLCLTSWLVGLNTGLAVYAFRNRPSSPSMTWLGGLGAIVGLFTACPTCAGLFMLSSLGLSTVAVVSLQPFQEALIVIGLLALAISPLLTSRYLKMAGSRTCAATRNKR